MLDLLILKYFFVCKIFFMNAFEFNFNCIFLLMLFVILDIKLKLYKLQVTSYVICISIIISIVETIAD